LKKTILTAKHAGRKDSLIPTSKIYIQKQATGQMITLAGINEYSLPEEIWILINLPVKFKAQFPFG